MGEQPRGGAPGLPRTQLVVISHDGGGDAPRLVQLARAALGSGRGQVSEASMPGLDVLWVGTGPEDLVDPVTGRVAVRLTRRPRLLTGREVDGDELVRRLTSSTGADGLAAPFAAVVRAGHGHPVVAATDHVGLRHLHHRSGPGWTAVATAGSLLARLHPTSPDTDAVGFYALAGCYAGDSTPWRDVRRLAPGARWSAVAGTATTLPGPDVATRRPSWSFGDAVEVGREAVVAAVAGALAEPGPVTLELSGGLDSRLLLAAVPEQERPRLRAVTIGGPSSADVRLARRLATDLGLPHQVVDRPLPGSSAEARDLVEVAAARGDWSTNPLATAALLGAERLMDQGPRLSGQNGEFARGFYYGGQPRLPSVATVPARALARWRVFANDRVDDDLLSPPARAAALQQSTQVVVDLLTAAGGEWLTATDELYLGLRMRSWVGTEFTVSSTDRPVLAPFFDPRFLDWSRGCSPRHKRGSRVLAAVLTSLDPALSDVPLASGTTPRRLASRSPAAGVRRSAAGADKVVRKVRQRLDRSDRPALGASDLASRVQAAWASGAWDMGPLDRLELLDQRTLADVAAGRRTLSPSGVGLLLDLAGVLDACAPQRGP